MRKTGMFRGSWGPLVRAVMCRGLLRAEESGVRGSAAASLKVPAYILIVKNVCCIDFNFNAYRALNPAGVWASFTEMLARHAAGRLRPHVCQTTNLAEADRTIETLLVRGSTGKIVLTMGHLGC